MTVRYALNEELNLIYVKVDGRLTFEDMVSFEAKFIADKRIRPGFKALFDASLVRVSDLNQQLPESLLAMEKMHPDLFAGSRRALLFADDLSWQLAKYFSDNADGNVVVLYALDVALIWLGVTRQDLPVIEA